MSRHLIDKGGVQVKHGLESLVRIEWLQSLKGAVHVAETDQDPGTEQRHHERVHAFVFGQGHQALARRR